MTKKISTALISVFHKDGLEDILKKLNAEGVKFLSTGGTQAFIESLGYPCQKVEGVTTYPSILGGRVKTLHPKIFGGILGRRDLEGDRQQMSEYEIPEIDLVIVDLYPFEQTVASGASEADIIEKIDIGGISLKAPAGYPERSGCRDDPRAAPRVRHRSLRCQQPLRHRHPRVVH